MTLSELIVVIVILGILVAIALFAYRTSVNNSHDVSAKNAVQQIAHDAAGAKTGSLQKANFEEALPSFGDGRFDQAGEISNLSTRFGQFAVGYSDDGQTAGVAVRSNSGRCATGVAKINSAVINLRISDGVPAVCTAYTDLVQAGYTPAPPTYTSGDTNYPDVWDQYREAVESVGGTPQPRQDLVVAEPPGPVILAKTGRVSGNYRISWDAPTTGGIPDGYRVYRVTPDQTGVLNGLDPDAVWWTQVADVTNTYYEFTPTQTTIQAAITNNNAAWGRYYVKPYNTYGDGAASNQIQVADGARLSRGVWASCAVPLSTNIRALVQIPDTWGISGPIDWTMTASSGPAPADRVVTGTEAGPGIAVAEFTMPTAGTNLVLGNFSFTHSGGPPLQT